MFTTASEFGAPGENCHEKNCAGNDEKKEDGDALLVDSKKKHRDDERN